VGIEDLIRARYGELLWIIDNLRAEVITLTDRNRTLKEKEQEDAQSQRPEAVREEVAG
jgi:hypothetical protein